MNPAWLLVYVTIFEIGTTDKHIRFDHRFEDLKSCQEYAMGKENQKYMQETYKDFNPKVRMVYPGCETESRHMYLDYMMKQGI